MESPLKRVKNEATTWAALLQMPDNAEYVDYTRDLRQVLYQNADPLLLMQMANSDRKARMLDLNDNFWRDFFYRDFPLEAKNKNLIKFAFFVRLVIAFFYDIDVTRLGDYKDKVQELARDKLYVDRPWKQLYIAVRQWYGAVFVLASVPLWMQAESYDKQGLEESMESSEDGFFITQLKKDSASI